MEVSHEAVEMVMVVMEAVVEVSPRTRPPTNKNEEVYQLILKNPFPLVSVPWVDQDLSFPV